MTVPLNQAIRVGAYVVKQHLIGRKRYPLVLMLEPLFRCNLACAGCGKIDYPAEILNQRLSVAECMEAVEECGAPVVVIAGGEPLLHKEIDQIVQGAIARKKFVIVCTNALLLEKKMDLFKPSKWFSWSVHLDGGKKEHDISVCQDGVYDRAVAAIGESKRRGFRTIINATLFNNAEPEKVAAFFDDVMAMGVDGISVSPGYAYERAPDQQHFLNRSKTKELFRGIFRRQGKGTWKKKWSFNQSSMFLDFLAGNQTFHCTPWGNPTRTYFGWQRPCYLLGEGYTKTFKGQVRHRQLRKMRRLHGPLGLRGQRSGRDGSQAVAGRGTGAARHPHGRSDGAGCLAGKSTAGRIRIRTPRRDRTQAHPNRQEADRGSS
jgi:hopanoid biosynthesis associated radical SAM protein HpnH